MGTGLTSLKDVVYYVLDENGQPMGQAQKLEAVEASITYDDIIESKKDHEPFYRDLDFSWSGEFTLLEPWNLFSHPYEDKLLVSKRLAHFFKQILLPRMAIYKMAEGMEKLEQVRKQENSRRWDFV